MVSVDDTKFAVQMPADHGDSGGRPSTKDSSQAARVSMWWALSSLKTPRRPGVIYCSTIGAINNFLSQTWGGTDWDMD